MSLIVEDGSGLSNAESYLSVLNADTYFSNRGMDIWNNATTAEKEEALRRSTDYMIHQYRSTWKGYRRLITQSLDWPRIGVVIEEYSTGFYQPQVDYTTVPQDIKNACAELALRATMGPLQDDLTQGVIQETIGPITVKYDSNSIRSTQYMAVVNALRIYLKNGNSNRMVALARV